MAVEDDERMNLRVRPQQNALLAAKAVIEDIERTVLSEKDSLLVLHLLEEPAAPNAKLRAAIAALPKPKRSGTKHTTR